MLIDVFKFFLLLVLAFLTTPFYVAGLAVGVAYRMFLVGFDTMSMLLDWATSNGRAHTFRIRAPFPGEKGDV